MSYKPCKQRTMQIKTRFITTAAVGLRLTRRLKMLVRSRTACKNTDQKKDKSCLEVVKCSFVYETGSSDPKHSSKVMAKGTKVCLAEEYPSDHDYKHSVYSAKPGWYFFQIFLKYKFFE